VRTFSPSEGTPSSSLVSGLLKRAWEVVNVEDNGPNGAREVCIVVDRSRILADTVCNAEDRVLIVVDRALVALERGTDANDSGRYAARLRYPFDRSFGSPGASEGGDDHGP
jgi:hypothetical protein